MLFSSVEFIFIFLPIVIIIYFMLKKYRFIKNIFLLISSLFFYSQNGVLGLMIRVIFINWVFGILIGLFSARIFIKKFFMILVITINLSILFWYKYRNFFIENINFIFKLDLPIYNIILPLGISFFIFQAISYIIDIYRGNGKVQRNPFYIGLYLAFFPQLIAGPIVRYETVAEEIEHREEKWKDFSGGVSRFIVGLGKKILIANIMGQAADLTFTYVNNGIYESSTCTAWFGAIAYTFQIFFDFSGYSDMAIGLGKMFGFHFLENFNFPYMSKSVSEFWRRWHISLQTWFRDYVYFPLGGSQVESKVRLVFNIFIVWLLTGVWHGANWTFILWGLMYFILILIEKLSDFPKKIGWFGHIYTMFFVIIGWVLFRSQSISSALIYLKAMFGIKTKGGYFDSLTIELIQQYKVFLVAAILFSFPVFWKRKRRNIILFEIAEGIILIVIFIISTFYIFNNAYNPFIYFNF